jgi:hypothetical protein
MPVHAVLNKVLKDTKATANAHPFYPPMFSLLFKLRHAQGSRYLLLLAMVVSLATVASPSMATLLAGSMTVTKQINPSNTIPVTPAVPNPAPEPFSPVRTGISDLGTTDTPLGIGYLRPQLTLAAANQQEAGWLSAVTLPIYANPGTQPWGWLYKGWLIPGGQRPLAIGRDATFTMVRIDGNMLAFPVLESRPDGWMRIQYTVNGTAWVHSSHFTLGETDVMFETWEEQVRTAETLRFRDASGAQVLRSQPELARNVITLINTDALIEPIEIQGDWVKVKVTRPVSACRPLTGATTDEGWMRWRDDTGNITLWDDSSRCR